MNREIKFRAWQKWHEYMFTPDYIDFINGNIIIGEHDGDSRYEDIPLMQYTGLKDKNGKEIYEGDILKPTIENENKLGKIVWLENRSAFGIHWFLQLGVGDIEYCVNNMKMEIIGNIYENPEFRQSSE